MSEMQIRKARDKQEVAKWMAKKASEKRKREMIAKWMSSSSSVFTTTCTYRHDQYITKYDMNDLYKEMGKRKEMDNKMYRAQTSAVEGRNVCCKGTRRSGLERKQTKKRTKYMHGIRR